MEPPETSNRGNVMLHLARCFIALALLASPALAQAQDNYPDRPIRFVVAFPPGGATDTFFRQISNELGTALGQTVVIENRGGAGGFVGWQYVASAPPDGYTLLVAENALGINQALFKKHPSGFNPLKDYDAVGAMASVPVVWTVLLLIHAVAIIRLTATGTRRVNQRRAKAVAVLLDSAQADPAAAEMLRVTVRYYRETLATLARRLEDLGAVQPPDLNRAADVFWYLFGWTSWRTLITDLQWSWDEAEQWLAQQGIDALLKPARPRP